MKLHLQLDARVFNFAGLFTDYKILVSAQFFNLTLKGSHFFSSTEQSEYQAVSPPNPKLLMT